MSTWQLAVGVIMSSMTVTTYTGVGASDSRRSCPPALFKMIAQEPSCVQHNNTSTQGSLGELVSLWASLLLAVRLQEWGQSKLSQTRHRTVCASR